MSWIFSSPTVIIWLRAKTPKLKLVYLQSSAFKAQLHGDFEKIQFQSIVRNSGKPFVHIQLASASLVTLIVSFSVIAVCHTSTIDISGVYKLLIILEALGVSIRSWFVFIRITLHYIRSNNNGTPERVYKYFLLKMLICYFCDLLETITTIVTIVSSSSDFVHSIPVPFQIFGFFIRRRFMSLLLISHLRRLLCRILYFDYPSFESLSPELKLVLN